MMVNKHQVREQEFAMLREWAERQSSEQLKKWLESKEGLVSGGKTMAKQVLRERGDF